MSLIVLIKPWICSGDFLSPFDDNEQEPFALVDFSNATLSEDGTKECVNTTGIMETYEKLPVYDCIHRNEEQCSYSYVTQFAPAREKVCEENYEKSCKVRSRLTFSSI